MAKKSKQKSKQKLTKKQQEERLQAAREREEREKAARERKENLKRIGIVIVCVILALALGLPVAGLLAVGGA